MGCSVTRTSAYLCPRLSPCQRHSCLGWQFLIYLLHLNMNALLTPSPILEPLSSSSAGPRPQTTRMTAGRPWTVTSTLVMISPARSTPPPPQRLLTRAVRLSSPPHPSACTLPRSLPVLCPAVVSSSRPRTPHGAATLGVTTTASSASRPTAALSTRSRARHGARSLFLTASHAQATTASMGNPGRTRRAR